MFASPQSSAVPNRNRVPAFFGSLWRTLWLASFATTMAGNVAKAQNLDRAIATLDRVLQQKGVDKAWFGEQRYDPATVEPIVLTAVWHDVDRTAGEALKDLFGSAVVPYGVLGALNARNITEFGDTKDANAATVPLALVCNHTDYEEAALTSLFGPNHTHYRIIRVELADMKPLPRVREELAPGGVVDYRRVADHVKRHVETRFSLTVSRTELTPTLRPRRCRVETQWYGWKPGTASWMRESFAWRAVFEVTKVTGARHLCTTVINTAQGSSETRLALISSLEIGRRRGGEFQPILQVPPMAEAEFSTAEIVNVQVSRKKYTQRTVSHGSPPTEPFSQAEWQTARDFITGTAHLHRWADRLFEVHKSLADNVIGADPQPFHLR